MLTFARYQQSPIEDSKMKYLLKLMFLVVPIEKVKLNSPAFPKDIIIMKDNN